ncbi:MAG: phospho-N-acetylmuramoyl-pentapeptide-transferase [Oscillospiraceae bacterium]|nr:phospho-N-acetylmuramoyl-pentapeptide-transferase [Oscillospiraceae bacterium]
MLGNFVQDDIIFLISAIISFGLTLAGILGFAKYLPKDHGREFAVNGSLSKGKARGAGLILILALIISCVICLPLNLEYMIYLVALFVEMMSGYLDDASEKPWGELKKGLIDLVVAVGVSVTVYYFHGGTILMPIFGLEAVISPPVYIILGVILIWASINVTNCADGVDGLCASLSIVTLTSVFLLMHIVRNLLTESQESAMLFVWIAILMLVAYLWFNCSPSSILMGDAGSRAIGLFIAIAFMLSGMPILFIPCALLLILDGGLGLVKLTILRVTKSKNFMKNIRTPIHDHARKNKHWSDTQVVIRFVLIQILLSTAVMLSVDYLIK